MTEEAERDVLWSVDDGGVGWLVLNRPDKHNAQTPSMWKQIRALDLWANSNPNVRCVLVAGNGPSFSAGLDLEVGLPDVARRVAGGEDLGSLPHTFNWLRYGDKPSIAAVQGHAYGAGLQLALACDIRLFADDATVGLLEPRHGLVADMGGTELLPRIVGAGVAAELVLTGRVVDAEEALRIGLANRVVPSGELRSEAAAMATALAATPAAAASAAKEALLAAFGPNGASHQIAARRQAGLIRARTQATS